MKKKFFITYPRASAAPAGGRGTTRVVVGALAAPQALPPARLPLCALAPRSCLCPGVCSYNVLTTNNKRNDKSASCFNALIVSTLCRLDLLNG